MFAPGDGLLAKCGFKRDFGSARKSLGNHSGSGASHESSRDSRGASGSNFVRIFFFGLSNTK